MHKLAKGLKKKKKSKKGKKGAEEEEFDPEELERYRRERAEALEKAALESTGESEVDGAKAAVSEEWKKFEALTAGVDTILKEKKAHLTRIQKESFFQRKIPIVEEKKPEEDPELKKEREKRYLGFDKDGNPIEQTFDEINNKKDNKLCVKEDGFVEIPDDDDEQKDSDDDDCFDTDYIDVLKTSDIQLAYIPESPTEEEIGDDPFDTTNADKVLKTVDKRGKKVVSLGNAVEVLSGRIDHVSTCKISRPRKIQGQDLLLGDDDTIEYSDKQTESFQIEKTLLDDDTDLPDVPIDLTNLPKILSKPIDDEINGIVDKSVEIPLDISEFEILKEKTVLEEIPDFDDDFDINGPIDESVKLDEVDDPFAEKESEHIVPESEIIEASFETATYVDEEDPFDTAFAENLIPGKVELKFIEKELEELPESEVSISLTDPAGLRRDYETGLLTKQETNLFNIKKDLLGGSTTDLSKLVDQPIAPVEELTYVDPFDTSGIQEIPPGQTELKFLEKELLGENNNQTVDNIDDDEFDPRKEEIQIAQPTPSVANQQKFEIQFEEENNEIFTNQDRKPSRPEVLGLTPVKTVAFELPTPSQRPDLLITGDEEKSIASKPLTPYYSQKSLEETLPDNDEPDDNVDPFDTSFVSKVTPGKTELKLIESELLTEETKLSHSISDHDFNKKNESQLGRRQSDFTATTLNKQNFKLKDIDVPLLEDTEKPKNAFIVNETVHRRKIFESKRQESLLDADVAVDAKPLTPRIESKVLEEEEEISYVDPFDTSIASNILPGKAELKLLESELSQVSSQPIQPKRINTIDLNKVSLAPKSTLVLEEEEEDFDPRAGEIQDFLSLDGQDSGDKVLTPLYNSEFDDDIDPFDTSFAAIGPGKTELKLLESELMDK